MRMQEVVAYYPECGELFDRRGVVLVRFPGEPASPGPRLLHDRCAEEIAADFVEVEAASWHAEVRASGGYVAEAVALGLGFTIRVAVVEGGEDG